MNTVTILAGMASAAVVITTLVGGTIWLVRRLMSLGVWLSALNRNATSTEHLADEVAKLSSTVQAHTVALIEQGEKIDHLEKVVVQNGG